MKITLENTPYTTKEKFLSNGNNKKELISFLRDAFERVNIDTVCCRDDADTSIVASALQNSLSGTVEVRAEDADVLILLIHHFDQKRHTDILFTTTKGSFSVQSVVEQLSLRQKRYLLFCHSFSGCDTVSSIFGFSKEKIYEKLCCGEVDALIETFYDIHSTSQQIRNAGIELFQYIYNAHGTPLSTLRVNRYNKQSKAGVLRPEKLPPTDGSAMQHALRTYLQLHDWIFLKSMSLDPEQYGWCKSFWGYEPIFTDIPIAPANLLKLISCNCSGDCSTRRCSCMKNNVKCVSACGTCHGNQCKNVRTDVANSE